MHRKSFGTSIMHCLLFFLLFFFSRDLHTKQKKQSGRLKIPLVINFTAAIRVLVSYYIRTDFKRPLPCRANDWTCMVKIV